MASPTSSMSVVRKLFWTVVMRFLGGSSSPEKYALNGAMPAFVSRSVGSAAGMRDADGRRRWPRSSKNRRNVSRKSCAVITCVYSWSSRGATAAGTANVCCRRPKLRALHAPGLTGSGSELKFSLGTVEPTCQSRKRLCWLESRGCRAAAYQGLLTLTSCNRTAQ